MSIQLTDPEDAKLLTLARASRSRARVAGAAAVRDTDGRTYTAADIDLPSLQLSALQVAVAMAISSGVEGLEAGVVMTDALSLDEIDVTVVREFAGDGIVLYRANGDGAVVDSTTT